MYFHFEWFSVILRLNAYELLAFVYIFVECTLPRQSPIAKRVLHKRRLKLIDVIDRHVMIFLTSYFGTTPMADVLFHVISYVINSVPSLRFVYGRLGDLQITAYFKGIIYITSLVAQRVFTSMMRIMQDANLDGRAAGRRADYFRLRLWTYHRRMNTCMQYNHAIRICIALLWRHGIV